MCSTECVPFRQVSLHEWFFGRICKIVNFHPIHLKLEEEVRICSLNSTTNYFWGRRRPKGHQPKLNNLSDQFISRWEGLTGVKKTSWFGMVDDLRWWWTAGSEAEREDWYWREWESWFHSWENEERIRVGEWIMRVSPEESFDGGSRVFCKNLETVEGGGTKHIRTSGWKCRKEAVEHKGTTVLSWMGK